MPGNATFSIIGSDVTITGNIAAKVDLHVDGRVEGDIACASLVQGEGSSIQGAIVAETARLSGTANGSIEAREPIIEASARITGDVVYETITIVQGGHVDGQFKHKGKAGQASAATATGQAAAQPRLAETHTDRPALPLTGNAA